MGVQNESPQDVLLQYRDRFDLKGSRETSPSLNCLEELEFRDLSVIRDYQR